MMAATRNRTAAAAPDDGGTASATDADDAARRHTAKRRAAADRTTETGRDGRQRRRLAGSLVTHESDKALARPYSVQQRSHRLTGVGAIEAALVWPIVAERL